MLSGEQREKKNEGKCLRASEKCRTPLITPTYALNYNTRRRIEREWSRKTYLKNID